MARDDAWRSRKGWFTLISLSPSSGLSVLELKESEAKLVRALGGTLWDREGFSEDVLARWMDAPNKKFLQFKRYRLFIPADICACQKTGWKPYGDRD
jgi:hypothetical protein